MDGLDTIGLLAAREVMPFVLSAILVPPAALIVAVLHLVDSDTPARVDLSARHAAAPSRTAGSRDSGPGRRRAGHGPVAVGLVLLLATFAIVGLSISTLTLHATGALPPALIATPLALLVAMPLARWMAVRLAGNGDVRSAGHEDAVGHEDTVEAGRQAALAFLDHLQRHPPLHPEQRPTERWMHALMDPAHPAPRFAAGALETLRLTPAVRHRASDIPLHGS